MLDYRVVIITQSLAVHPKFMFSERLDIMICV